MTRLAEVILQRAAESTAGKAEASEKILAPEGEEKAAGKLWTPGDE